jgi:ketosteroid isomerase-like protein
MLALMAAFVLGVGVDRAFHRSGISRASIDATKADLAGVERLHHLDERVTILNDPKALQAEWTDGAVRLNPDGTVDIGKAAIYAADVHSFADAPGSAIVSYRPDIRDVQLAGEWAFEWGSFVAGYRPSTNKPVQEVHGKFLRVLHRGNDGEWKFARVMVVLNTQ